MSHAHLFNKHLLSTRYVPGIGVGGEDITVNQTKIWYK